MAVPFIPDHVINRVYSFHCHERADTEMYLIAVFSNLCIPGNDDSPKRKTILQTGLIDSQRDSSIMLKYS
ncbi:MAG: hypothetical protein ACTSRU_03830 [Candidatus Hodarchaeales archaeon]